MRPDYARCLQWHALLGAMPLADIQLAGASCFAVGQRCKLAPGGGDSPCSYSYVEHHHHGGGCIKSMLCMLQGAGGRLLRCARVPTCC